MQTCRSPSPFLSAHQSPRAVPTSPDTSFPPGADRGLGRDQTGPHPQERECRGDVQRRGSDIQRRTLREGRCIGGFVWHSTSSPPHCGPPLPPIFLRDAATEPGFPLPCDYLQGYAAARANRTSVPSGKSNCCGWSVKYLSSTRIACMFGIPVSGTHIKEWIVLLGFKGLQICSGVHHAMNQAAQINLLDTSVSVSLSSPSSSPLIAMWHRRIRLFPS